MRAHCPPRRWPRSASVTSPAEIATGGGGRAGGTAPAAGSRVACRLPSGPGGATRPGGANRTKRRGASRRLLSLSRAGGQPGGEHIGTWYAVEACPGPSWGRETADNNGQPRCPTDNQTCSSSAVIGRDGPLVRIWHARGQGQNPLSSTRHLDHEIRAHEQQEPWGMRTGSDEMSLLLVVHVVLRSTEASASSVHLL